MTKTLLWLSMTTFRNRCIVGLRRLREPKYLIGFVAALVYFWFTFARRLMMSRGFHSLQAPQFALLRVEFGGLLVLVIMLLAWLLPEDSGGLEFSAAEIQFLFPAPIARWQLLLYNKLLRTQPQIIGTCLVASIAGFGGRMFIGLWLAYTSLNVYFTFVAFARARLRQMHINVFVRLVLIGGAFAALTSHVLRSIQLSALRDAMKKFGSSGTMPALGGPFDSAIMRPLLFLPRQYVQTAAPTSVGAFLLASAIVGVAGVAFFLLAMQLDVAFEEASITYSAKRAERAARRTNQHIGTTVSVRRFPPLFRMRETGPPEVAIVWKNLIGAMRTSAVWMLIIVVVVALMFYSAFRVHDESGYAAIGVITLVFAAMFPLIGAGLINADLRTDLSRLEILKSFPIAGDRLVAAELAAPLIIISVVEALLLVSGSVLVHLAGHEASATLQLLASSEMVVVFLLATIPLCATQLVIRNGAALLFPAWAVRSKFEPRGFAVTGQRLIYALGLLFITSLALLPPLVVFAIAFLIGSKLLGLAGPIFLAVIALPPIATLLAEVWMTIHLLGTQYDRLDISNDLDAMTV